MTYSLWWLWVIFLGVFLLPSVGYGWGYRGWGPPLPAAIQRRRALSAKAAGGTSTFDHHAWGRGGDIIWAMLVVSMIWAIAMWVSRGRPW